jgi:hypothetical protein
MQTYHVGLMALAIFGLLGLFAYLSWVSKIRKQEAFIEPPQILESEDAGQGAFYVATTLAGKPLERVVAHGLAHRGRANVLVSSDGISIYRTGEKSFRISTKDLVAVNQSSAVIDRAVEKDGLVSIQWKLGGTAVETHLRFVGSKERSTTLSQLKDMVA